MRDKIVSGFRRSGHNPLKVEVVQTFFIAHQTFASRLMTWILELFQKSSGFRSIFCDVIFSVRTSLNESADFLTDVIILNLVSRGAE